MNGDENESSRLFGRQTLSTYAYEKYEKKEKDYFLGYNMYNEVEE
jgi:hypothetical protein